MCRNLYHLRLSSPSLVELFCSSCLRADVKACKAPSKRRERRDNYKWVRCAVQCAVSLHIGAMWSGQHAPCILQFVFIVKCIAQFFTRTVHSTVVQLSDPHSGGRQLVNTTITELTGRLRDAAAANFNFKEQYNWISTFYQIRDMQRTWWAMEVKQIVGEGTFEKEKTDKGLNHRN